MDYSFRFLDKDLNAKLVSLLRKAKIPYTVDTKGVVHYSSADEEQVGNDLICSIRDRVFASWQILTCPSDWTDRYRAYMSRHHVPFTEECSNGELWFLIPRNYRPHSWKIDDAKAEPRKRRMKVG